MIKRKSIFAANKPCRLFLFIIFCLWSALSSAQNRTIDSLQQELKNLKSHPENLLADTTLINTLNTLSREMINAGIYIRADSLAREAMTLAEEMLPRNKGVNEITIRKAIANSLRNIGIVYEEQGRYSKALESFLSSLRINEKLGNKKGISANLSSIGIVYKELADYPKALEYYFRALKIAEELGNKNWKAINLVNIGNVYSYQNKYPKALEFYFKALVINEQLDNKTAIANNLGNIGIVYKDQGEYAKALEYYFKALKMAEKLGNKSQVGRHTGNIGALYLKQKKYKEAEDYLQKALKISSEIGDLNVTKEWHENLSELYGFQGRSQLELEHFKKYIVARDSIYNRENTLKTLSAQMNFDYEKKVAADSVKNTEKQKIKDAEILAQQSQLSQEKTQRYSLYGGLLLVLIFSGFLYNRFKITNNQKRLIERQKHTVEKKNKEVMDSINYARRIQEALLKEEEHVTAHLPEHFVLYKPKDIVSGDFYWSQEKKSIQEESKGDIYWYLCVADCTGHGVPGAFMSMPGIAYLNEINASENVFSPAEILDKLREKIVKELKQSGEMGESKDGMDVSIMRFNLRTRELQWAGANNPLWIIKNADDKVSLAEVKADKQPIGYTINPTPFTNHNIRLSEGDIIYLFTDGYADQFGGSKGKKFKYKQLQEKLIDIGNESLAAQKEILNAAFEDWRGELEQLDDVAMIGVRF